MRSRRADSIPKQEPRQGVGTQGGVRYQCPSLENRGAPRQRPSGGFLLAVGARWLYAQHDLCRCFHLCWSGSLLRGNHGVAPASLGPKALLVRKPERSALRRRRYGAAPKRRNWSSGRFANRGGTRPHGVGRGSSHRPTPPASGRCFLLGVVPVMTRPARTCLTSPGPLLWKAAVGASPSAIAIGLKPSCPKIAVDGSTGGRIPN
jgi:hypothetical protein